MPEKKTVEPIFKIEDGIVKLYPFEKHYIIVALKEYIEPVEKQVTNIQAALAEEKTVPNSPPRLLASLEGSLPLLGHMLSELKIVLERVEATPVVGGN